MDDISAYTMIIVFCTLTGTFALVIGRLLDPLFRAEVMRNGLKWDVGAIGYVTKDKKRINIRSLINFKQDTFIREGKQWLVEKKYLYETDVKEKSINLNQEDNYKALINGVPVYFIDESTYTPLGLFKSQKDANNNEIQDVSPEDLGSTNATYLKLQKLKQIKSMENNQLIIMAILFLALIAAVASGYSVLKSSEMQEAIKAQSGLIENAAKAAGNATKITVTGFIWWLDGRNTGK